MKLAPLLTAAICCLLFALKITMFNLDIRTLIFIAMLSSILLAIGLQFVSRVIVRDPRFAYGLLVQRPLAAVLCSWRCAV